MSSILPKNELENVNFCPSLLGKKFFVRFLGELKKQKALLKLTDLNRLPIEDSCHLFLGTNGVPASGWDNVLIQFGPSMTSWVDPHPSSQKGVDRLKRVWIDSNLRVWIDSIKGCGSTQDVIDGPHCTGGPRLVRFLGFWKNRTTRNSYYLVLHSQFPLVRILLHSNPTSTNFIPIALKFVLVEIVLVETVQV